jgi:hypothetical protein
MTTQTRPRRRSRGLIVLAIACAGLTGMVGGAIGGAAGAYWVIEKMAKPRFAPKIKNAVVSYDMPSDGARPVDILGINKAGTPLNPCLISFLEDHRDILPNADWRAVRINPYFKIEPDIITEMAFARGVAAITRRNEIYVRVPDATEGLNGMNERLMFHELVHVDQYASGRLDLPDYAARAAYSYANGSDAHDNAYEREARAMENEILRLWIASPQRRTCHADVGDDLRRAPSERPHGQYAIFNRERLEYELVEHTAHTGREFTIPLPDEEKEAEDDE